MVETRQKQWKRIYEKLDLKGSPFFFTLYNPFILQFSSYQNAFWYVLKGRVVTQQDGVQCYGCPQAGNGQLAFNLSHFSICKYIQIMISVIDVR